MEKTKTEELLNSIDLTMDEVYKIIGYGIKQKCKANPYLRSYTTQEDLVHDVLAYYLSTMKSTGEIRLNYYIKKYQDKEHIISMLSQTSYQLPAQIMHSKSFRNRSYLLEDIIRNDEDGGSYNQETMQENISMKKGNTVNAYFVDDKAEGKIYDNINTQEAIDMIIEKLNEYNYHKLKVKAEKENPKGAMPFLLDTKNCLRAYSMTLKQLDFILDICNGDITNSIIKKNSELSKDIRAIRSALRGSVENYLRTY